MAAFADRDALEAGIVALLDRTDVAAQVPLWVALCEAGVNRMLRASDMLVRKVATTDKQYTAMPEDARELQRVVVKDRTFMDPVLAFITPTQMGTYNGDQPAGDPVFYTINGRQIELGPIPSVSAIDLELWYYRGAALGDEGDDTNWLLEKHPDIYFYGSLMHAAPYLRNPERIEEFKGFYERAMADLTTESERLRVSGGPLNRVGGIRT